MFAPVCCHWACSQWHEPRSESRFGMCFGPFPDLKAWFYPLWTQSSFKSGFWNAFWNAKKRGVLDRDLPRKPDEDMWMQSSFGTWFVRVHFGNARWSHAWINQRGLRRRHKISPPSAQILFVIGTMGVFTWTRITFRKTFQNVIRPFPDLKAWF